MPSKKDDWFKKAYPQCIAQLTAFLRRFVGSREVAEDLAHEAFLKVWTSPNFDQSQSTRGYLFRTARNLALDWRDLHSVSRTVTIPEAADIIDERASVELQAMTTDEFNTLCKAMGRLTPRQNDVLTLRAFFEFSCQEIADKLKIDRSTVHRELARAIAGIHAAMASVESEKVRRSAQVMSLEREGESGA